MNDNVDIEPEKTLHIGLKKEKKVRIYIRSLDLNSKGNKDAISTDQIDLRLNSINCVNSINADREILICKKSPRISE